MSVGVPDAVGRRGPEGAAPRVALGMMVYNEERYVAEALRSLLAQSYPDFRLYVVDDGSTDGTWEVVRSVAQRDSRVRSVRNERRLGMGANYLKTFSLSGGESEFWAWAAGHDRHHPDWLGTLVRALDEHPEAVLAYPLTVRISESGERYPGFPSPRFETTGLDLPGRIRAMRRGGYRVGDMVYGLFRTEALERAGVFPQHLLPDVLLLWRLAQFGTVVQVPEELWCRRFVGLFSIARQRRNLFFGRAPWHAFLPWPLVNAAAFFRAAVVDADGGWRGRWEGLRLTGAFLSRYWPYVLLSSRPMARLLERPVRAYLRWKHGEDAVAPGGLPARER